MDEVCELSVFEDLLEDLGGEVGDRHLGVSVLNVFFGRFIFSVLFLFCNCRALLVLVEHDEVADVETHSSISESSFYPTSRSSLSIAIDLLPTRKPAQTFTPKIER